MKGIAYALFTLAVLNILDYVLTYYALTEFKMIEVNPIIRQIHERFGMAGVFVWKQIAILIIAITSCIIASKTVEATLWLANTIFSLIIAFNTIQLFLNTYR
jgi:hypothetical protein